MSDPRKLPVSVVLADDDPGMTALLSEVLTGRGCTVRSAQSAEEAIRVAREVRPDVVVTDVVMGQVDAGIRILRTLKAEMPETIVILMTAYGTLEHAIEATREGAYDYLSKPFKCEELLVVLDRALESRRIVAENRELRRALAGQIGSTEIVGRSARMVEVFKEIARAVVSSAAVLIEGETGVGKELVARAIHAHSARRDRPFVAVNCAALPENLLESELFGHERGSFTGATGRRGGLFQEADGGTILLDEIGDMPLALQSKLLRTLQSGEVRPVGAAASSTVDVRVIASTNRNLRTAVAEGQFREDLFFRLNTLTIRVPPLRERIEDIPLLVERFIEKAHTRTGRTVRGISGEALAALTAHDWPGNVRELEHAIERAVAFARQEVILPEDLPSELFEPRASRLMSLEHMEKAHIQYVLKQCQGSRNRTAEVLGIDRKTLYRKLQKWGLERGEDDEDRPT